MAARKSTFPGFSKKMHSFFRGLERNNEREWFMERKGVYEEEVRGPMVELVGWVNEQIRGFAPFNAVEAPAKAIYRIYRDTRFSADKTPYKTHIGATFPRSGLPKHAGAGFYFGVSHRCVEIAGGVYMPGPEELAALRKGIIADQKGFLGLVGEKKLAKVMGELKGEKLKRVPKGWEEHAGSAVGEYLKLKQLYWFVELPAEVALRPAIGEEVVKHFRVMAEAMGWMNAVLMAARREGEEEGVPVRPEPMF